MNILYLNPDRGIPVLGGKGASVHVREFVTALAGQGHDVALVCATLGDGNAPPPARVFDLPPGVETVELLAEATRLGLPPSALDDRTTRRELGRLAYDRTFGARLHPLLEGHRFRPDVVYERYALFHSAGAGVARTLGVPRILEVNAPLVQEQERFRGLCLKDMALAAEQASFHGADAVMAVSDEVAAYVAGTGVAPERIHVVPNGVDTERFLPGGGAAAVRARLGLNDAPVVGFIGSFKPWHGVAFLIDAFAALARTHPGVRLLCVGEGPELEPAREMVAAHGLADRAVFTGRIPHRDIPSHLAAMDVSVAPYLPSPDFYFSPLKVVESLAVGTPVVASRIGQLEHLVDHGKTGLLFAPGDQADFTAKVLDLIRNVPARRDMAGAARRRALSEFDWDRVVSRTVDEARRLIAGKRAA